MMVETNFSSHLTDMLLIYSESVEHELAILYVKV